MSELKIKINAPQMSFALMDSFDLINVSLPEPVTLVGRLHGGFTVTTDDTQVEIMDVWAPNIHQTNEVSIRLLHPVDVKKVYQVHHPDYETRRVFFRQVLDDEKFIFKGSDLGVSYTKEASHFRVWAPTANRVELLLYPQGDSLQGQSLELKPDVNGTWVGIVEGDLHGKFYTYRIHVHGYVREAVDPYVKSVNVNGTKGAIIDLTRTNPAGFENTPRPQFKNYVDAVLYETHLRDLTIAEDSGVVHKGKYLGLTEENTHSREGLATGLAHLKELGITHVHFLPLMESEFIIDNEECYNWGYGTNFFFATEGQYVTDPHDPVKRLKEFKEMVQALHRNGIRVVLDVVYNHTGRQDPDVERIVPGYYLRRTPEGHLHCGSGVNNDFASERPMARKLIIDSVKYWAKDCLVDGFRFDLMGLHDRETMYQLEEELQLIDSSIIIYGEAWTMSTGLAFEQLMLKGAQRGRKIAIFNDNVRDTIASGGMAPVTNRGFASGRPGIEASIKKAVVGSIEYDQARVYNIDYASGWQHEIINTLAPGETINYVSCHDNYALRDRLERSNPEVAENDRERMSMLANGIVLTSQGVPFLAGGVEIYKTKFGDENSYESPDYINEIPWFNKKTYYRMFKFYQGLITLRKAHPAFRMPTAEEIRQNLVFHDSPEGTVLFTLHNHANGDPWQTIAVIYNQRPYQVSVGLPGANWQVVVEGDVAGLVPLRTVEGNWVEVPPISLMVLYQE